jgi:hypothetical protein
MTPDPDAIPPTTTVQQDLTTAGQRKVNLIWEYTQAFVAVIVVAVNLAVEAHAAFTKTVDAIPPTLSNAMFLIVGFYFSRTNHQAIGGIGQKPEQKYEGR